ncbi:MAG: ATP-binding protein [Verrucomicrobiota bacterium]
MKQGFLDKLIARIGRVGPEEVQSYLVRLVQEKGFLEKVFDALQEGIIVTDPEGTILYINRAACLFFGLDAEEALDKSVDSQVRGLGWSSLVQGGPVVSRDMEIFYPENRYLNFYLSPLEEEQEDPLGYVIFVRDLTMTRRMDEEKLESERFSALTMLAAGVAHEIGNPLNSLNIHLQLIERKLRKRDPGLFEGEIEDLLGVAREEITRLDFTVDQFLKAIRPSQPQREPVDLNELVSESVRFLEKEMADREVQVRMELHSNIPLVPLDANQMKQAFYNIMKNAMQAMSGEGELMVRTAMDDFEYTVTFTDTGDGISGEDMSKIFQPYYTTKKSGTGLGLLIVRRIIREHGGEIEISSRKTRGTRLVVHLPRTDKALRFLPPAKAGAVDGEGEVIEI